MIESTTGVRKSCASSTKCETHNIETVLMPELIYKIFSAFRDTDRDLQSILSVSHYFRAIAMKILCESRFPNICVGSWAPDYVEKHGWTQLSLLLNGVSNQRLEMPFLQKMPLFASKIQALALEGDRFAVALKHVIRIFALHSGQNIETIQISSNIIAMENGVLATASNAKVHAWNLDAKEHKVSPSDPDNILCLAKNADLIVSGQDDGTVKAWDLKTDLVTVLSGHTAKVNSVAINQHFIISGGQDGTIRIWDKNNFKFLKAFTSHEEGLNCLAVQGNVITSGGQDKKVRQWVLDIESPDQPFTPLFGMCTPINKIAFQEEFVIITSPGLFENINSVNVLSTTNRPIKCYRTANSKFFKKSGKKNNLLDAEVAAQGRLILVAENKKIIAYRIGSGVHKGFRLL